MAAALFPRGFHLPYRLVGVATLAKSVAFPAEIPFEQRIQHLCDCLLDHPAERSETAWVEVDAFANAKTVKRVRVRVFREMLAFSFS